MAGGSAPVRSPGGSNATVPRELTSRRYRAYRRDPRTGACERVSIVAMSARQFGRPHGPLGRLIGRGMARRNSDFSRGVVGEVRKERADEQQRIVELGPGPGIGLHETLKLFARAQVWGVDPSPEMLSMSRVAIAVGTALTGGPPRRSQRAELPHWAPALGIWRRSAPQGRGASRGRAQPSRGEWVHPVPGEAGSLAATPQRPIPAPGHLKAKRRHRFDVAGHGVVGGVASHHAGQPCSLHR